jgi:hypothetical protein
MGASFRKICVASRPVYQRRPFAGWSGIGGGEREGSGIQGSQSDAMTVEPVQPVEEAIVDILQREGNQDQGINGEFGD